MIYEICIKKYDICDRFDGLMGVLKKEMGFAPEQNFCEKFIGLPQSHYGQPPNNDLAIPVLTFDLLASLAYCLCGTLYRRQHLCVLIQYAGVFDHELRGYELLGPVPLAKLHDSSDDCIILALAEEPKWIIIHRSIICNCFQSLKFSPGFRLQLSLDVCAPRAAGLLGFVRCLEDRGAYLASVCVHVCGSYFLMRSANFCSNSFIVWTLSSNVCILSAKI